MQIKSQLENYKNLGLGYLQRMSDIRFAGQAVFVVIVLMVSWSGIKTIETNYNLQKQITALREQNGLQELQNGNLTLQNNYYNSNQYLELEARQNFGLAAPGEKEVVVPSSVADAYTVPLPTATDPNAASAKQPVYQRNFESWTNFFLHRQTSQN